jgi:hypothetical protein
MQHHTTTANVLRDHQYLDRVNSSRLRHSAAKVVEQALQEKQEITKETSTTKKVALITSDKISSFFGDFR